MRKHDHAGMSLYGPAGGRKYINAAERRRFIKAANRADPETRLFCLVLSWSGCRVSELLALTAAAVDIDSGVANIQFHHMNYSQTYPEIDFFNSIGRFPIPIMNAVWYRGEGGELSSRRAARSCDTEAWRENYWEAFQTGATSKTSEWEHEREYRLLLWSSMHNFKDDASRRLRYNCADLSGIIFGAKTAAEDKVRIVRIVAEKCKAEGRHDFEFYQMQYSRKERSFRIAPLGLIRLQ
jgi:hypothetical protein